MSNNATNVRPVFRDSSGNPRASGWVYFYNNKTLELADIYSDELLSVAQQNPYQLNAYGAIDGDVKYSGKLTVTHTNEDGSDPISDDDVESQGGATSDAYVDQFETIENSPANMAVVVNAGKVMTGETLVSIADQTTTLITAPTSNPRIDRVVVDKLTGVYTIVTGSESATPVAPAIPVGKMPSSQIALTTSTSTITEALITDERISGSIEPSNINTTETLSNKTLGDTNTINAQDDAFTIDDAADATLQIDFDVAGSTGTKTTVSSSQTVDRTLTLPDATDTLVGKATTDTLTNKTIGDSNTINAQDDAFTIDDAADATLQIDFNVAGTTGTKTTITTSQTANRVVTIPDVTDTLVTKTTTDTLTNKTIGDTNTINAQDDAFSIDDAADPTLQIDFNVAGTAGTKTTVTSSQTANRVITIPDATDTLVGKSTTDVLSNKTLTLPQINDTSLDHQYVFTVSELVADRNVNLPILTGNDEFTFNSHPQTLTGKTLTLPQINDTSLDHQYVFTVSELAADRNVNLPLLTGNDEFTFNSHPQVLSNKSFSDNPTISNSTPSLIIKDSDSTGSSQIGDISFTDSGDTEVGVIGFASASDTDLDIENKHTDGNVNLITSGFGQAQVNGSNLVNWIRAEQVGNDLNIPGLIALDIAALNSTDIAYIDNANTDLRTYRFDGTNWAQVGNDLNIIGGGGANLSALNGTDIAFVDDSIGDLRTYRFDGTDWAQVGNALSIVGMGDPTLAALSGTDVAFIDDANEDLRTYRFDGTDWAQVGNDLNISGINNPKLAALNSTDIAFIDTLASTLRTYRFDGTDWAQVGNSFSFPAAIGDPDITALNGTDVAFIEDTADILRIYRFDGTDWAQNGSDISIAGTITPVITALHGSDIAFMDAGNEDLRTYRFTFYIGPGPHEPPG